MGNQHPYQVRVFLSKEFAEAVSRHEVPKEVAPLMQVLAKHNATIHHNQFDEFSAFVQWADANLDKTQFPSPAMKEQMEKLSALTKNSLANEEKVSYFKREFTLSIGDKSQFTGSEADALISDIQKLGVGSVLTEGKGFAEGKSYDVEAVRKSYVPSRHPGT